MTVNGDTATMTRATTPDKMIIVRMTVQVTVAGDTNGDALEFTDVGRVFETTQGSLILEDIYGYPRAGYCRGAWLDFVVTHLDPLQPGDNSIIQSSPAPIHSTDHA